MPADNPNLSAEVAKLTEAVHDLRDREVADELARLREEVAALRAEKDSGSCHGHTCGCIHWHYTPQPWVPACQPVITWGSMQAGGTIPATGFMALNMNAAGAANTAYPVSLT